MFKVLLGLTVLTVLGVLADLWVALGRSVRPGPPDHRVRRLSARQALRVLTGESDLPARWGWTEPPERLAHLVPKGAKVFRDQQGRMAFKGQPVSEDQWVRLVSQAPRAIRDR